MMKQSIGVNLAQYIPVVLILFLTATNNSGEALVYAVSYAELLILTAAVYLTFIRNGKYSKTDLFFIKWALLPLTFIMVFIYNGLY